jgi:hypothetical protein
MHEINCVAAPGQTLTAKLLTGATVVVTGINLTESTVPGFYTGSVAGGTAAATYTVLVQSLGNVVASGVLHWSGAYETPAPANMTYVKGQAINGNGSADTPWGP